MNKSGAAHIHSNSSHRSFASHGGRVTKLNGRVASYAPSLQALFAGAAALVFGGLMAGSAQAANECGVAGAGTTVNCANPAYPAGISYTVNDLTVNVNGPVTIGTTGTPVVGVGVSNTGAGTGTTTTTTTGAVSIYTSPSYGYGLYSAATGNGNAVVSTSAGTYIETRGLDGAKGIFANAQGTGTATATNNGTILTTGLTGPNPDGNFGVYAFASGGNATAGNTGTITTLGAFGYGVYAVTSGNGTATATSSGIITTNGPYSTGIGAHIDNFDSTKSGTAIATLLAGGTVSTNGSLYGIGVFADVFGYGDALATSFGTIATKGQFGSGVAARVFYGNGDATATNNGAITTTGIDADGVLAVVAAGSIGNATAINTNVVNVSGQASDGIWVISENGDALVENTGIVNASGLDGNGVLVQAVGGTYEVNINAGSVTGGTGAGAGIRVDDGAAVNVKTGEINIAAGTLVTAASGTAIWEGNGKTVITSFGTVTGDILTNEGDDTLYLENPSVTSGDIMLGDGSDIMTVRGNADVTGVTLFDGGDDVYTGDTFVDKLTFEGGTRAIAGEILTNWESIDLTSGANLTLQGSNLLVGGGLDGNGAQLGLNVLTGSTLDFEQPVFTVMGDVSNAGTIALGNGAPGNILNVAIDPDAVAGASGNYIGNGGTLLVNTVLGTDGSTSDVLHVEGDTSGSSLVFVTNVGGTGAQTVADGILVVQVDGASNGVFSLSNKGGVAVAGAYAYNLFQGGVADPTDGDWYLRSTGLQPGTPIYESLPQVLQGLNGVPTLQQRVGNRYWNGKPQEVFCKDASKNYRCAVTADQAATYADGQGPVIDDQALWVRIEGTHGHFEPDTSTTGASFDENIWKLQGGVDALLHEGDNGKLIAGLTGHYGQSNADISSAPGDGSIDTTGYGLGGTLTWYGHNGFYLDGQGSATWYDSDLSSDSLGNLAKGNNGFGYALSLEAGQRVDLNNGWSTTPQLQLVYSSVDFDSFTGPNGEEVSLSDGDSLKGRAGLTLDREASWQASTAAPAAATSTASATSLTSSWMVPPSASPALT